MRRLRDAVAVRVLGAVAGVLFLLGGSGPGAGLHAGTHHPAHGAVAGQHGHSVDQAPTEPAGGEQPDSGDHCSCFATCHGGGSSPVAGIPLDGTSPPGDVHERPGSGRTSDRIPAALTAYLLPFSNPPPFQS